MITCNPQVTLDIIYSLVDDIDIYRYYLGNVKIGSIINSPFRKDNNPSFCIFTYNNRVVWKDFGSNDSGDVISYVMKKFNINFITALNTIYNDLSLYKLHKTSIIKPKKFLIDKSTSNIQIKIKDWNKENIKYWSKYGITKEILNYYNVYSISHLWINGKLIPISTNTYAYYYGFIEDIHRFKIYQPYSKRFKWLTNANKTIIQGYNKLPKSGDNLIITKSLKDVMVLYRLNIPSIAPSAESVILEESIINSLKLNFKNIYSLMDFDYTGIRNALTMKKKYQIRPLFLTNGRFNSINYKSKDISDYVKNNTLEKTNLLINKTKLWLDI